jgi:hypothetical protein
MSISAATTFIFMTLTQLLAGASAEEQQQRLSRWLQQNTSYSIKCDQSWAIQASGTSCLLAMKNFAYAYAQQKLPAPPEPITVDISPSGRWRSIDTTIRRPRMLIPDSATPDDIGRFVKSELSTPDYVDRLALITHLADLTTELEHKVGKQIEIAENVKNPAASEALYKLIMISSENPELFNSPVEVIRLSSDFLSIYEQNLKLKANIASNANVPEMRNFLDELRTKSGLNRFDAYWLPTFFERRKIIKDEELNLAHQFGLSEMHCSSMSALKQADCIGALQRLQRSFQLPRLELPKIDILIIMSPKEMPLLADYYFDSSERKSIMLVKATATLPQLRDFYLSRGWIVTGG